MTLWRWIKDAVRSPAEPDEGGQDYPAEADSKLGEALELGRRQLEEQKSITRELILIRKRMERGGYPMLGDDPADRRPR